MTKIKVSPRIGVVEYSELTTGIEIQVYVKEKFWNGNVPTEEEMREWLKGEGYRGFSRHFKRSKPVFLFTEDAVRKAYEKGGMADACYLATHLGCEWRFCQACNTEVPSKGIMCMVCGQDCSF
jgi:hypothetical protein